MLVCHILHGSIGKEEDRLAVFELYQDVIVRYEEHLVDFMQLLEADDVQFAGARGRLHDKAELLVVALTLGYLIRCH